MSRRVKSLHHNLQEGENVVFHREHRSPRNRKLDKLKTLPQYDRNGRKRWKIFSKSTEHRDYLDHVVWKNRIID